MKHSVLTHANPYTGNCFHWLYFYSCINLKIVRITIHLKQTPSLRQHLTFQASSICNHSQNPLQLFRHYCIIPILNITVLHGSQWRIIPLYTVKIVNIWIYLFIHLASVFTTLFVWGELFRYPIQSFFCFLLNIPLTNLSLYNKP